MKKFAVILSGCGVYDGTEIHEATMAILAICKKGYSYSLFAPDIFQHHVINHLNGQEMPEKRNVLVESARIARGNIKDLKELNVADFDALLLPGGFGAAKNWSDYAFKGENATLNTNIEKIIKDFHSARKPIGAMCIAPVLVAKALGNVKVTIGSDKQTANAIKLFGAIHQTTTVKEIVSDTANLVYSAPCYMLDTNIANVAEEAEKLVAAMFKF